VVVEQFGEDLGGSAVAAVDSQYIHALFRETLKYAQNIAPLLRDLMVDMRMICDNGLYRAEMRAVASAVRIRDQADSGSLCRVAGVQGTGTGSVW